MPSIVSVMGTSPGPTGAGPPPWASASGPASTPAATPVTPTVFRNARRLTPAPLSSAGGTAALGSSFGAMRTPNSGRFGPDDRTGRRPSKTLRIANRSGRGQPWENQPGRGRPPARSPGGLGEPAEMRTTDMLSRREFVRRAGLTGGAAALASNWSPVVAAAAAGASGRSAADVAARRGFLARDPGGLHPRPHDDQPEQRRRVPEPARRARGVQALPRPVEPGAVVLHVAGRGAQHRARPHAPRGGLRLRRRGAGDHAERERGAPDRAARPRPEGGRRGRHDQPGLPAHARHVGAARPSRRDRADEGLVPGAAALAGRSWRSACSPRSRRRRRCCTSATSRT